MTVARLYLDEDVDPLLARALADRGYDVLTTVEASRRAATDVEQLTFATHAGRAILTHNVAHFAQLAHEYRQAGQAHAGIILSAQLPFRSLLARTLRLLDRHTAESLSNALIWLQDFAHP
jgi:predicted nuclease of predicted toxin-antitoxin system